MRLEDALGERLLLWFDGAEASPELLALLRERSIGGVTLFRHLNGGPPARVRALTAALQAAAQTGGRPPLLICADQEGGQLQAIGGLTAFPGNMALGATGDPELARLVGAVIGAELAAVGVNVNYAPACDVNLNPDNPVIGTRAFGEDPALVARLGAAMVAGLQSAGVAAVAKHFPGHGDTAQDSHHALAVLPHSRARLDAVELPPFVAAIRAGVRLVMSVHLALPALTGDPGLPATLAPQVLRGLLRDDLAFDGVVVSDAMNMHGLSGGEAFGPLAVRAAKAGIDLLLLAPPNDHHEAYDALLAAVHDGRLERDEAFAAAARVRALKGWLAAQNHSELSLVGARAHGELAALVAARAITLVRNEAGHLPLRLASTARVAVVVPQTADLTPADTSSYERCELARAVRRYHPSAEEVVMSAHPSPDEVAGLRARLAGCDLVIVGTINAREQLGQAALVRALVRDGVAVVAAALRLPYDLAAYPEAPTYLCAYSIVPPAMDALADALWGYAPIEGRLPAGIPGHYRIGYGLRLSA